MQQVIVVIFLINRNEWKCQIRFGRHDPRASAFGPSTDQARQLRAGAALGERHHPDQGRDGPHDRGQHPGGPQWGHGQDAGQTLLIYFQLIGGIFKNCTHY